MSRVLVCGSRTYTDWERVNFVLDALHETDRIERVIQGCATGADTLGHLWAKSHDVPESMFPADWDKHGRAAGSLRNQQMLEEGRPDLVLAFIDKPLHASRGTADMIRRAERAGVLVRLVTNA